MKPVGSPIEPLAGEAPPIMDLIYQTCREILEELRKLNAKLPDRPDEGGDD